MPSRNRRATAAVEAAPQPTSYGPDNGGNAILAAWQGLYHLFGARVERFDVSPEGITAVGFTTDEKFAETDSLVGYLTKNRRLDFFPAYNWAQGEIPANFNSSIELTNWLTKSFKVAGQKGRSPKFVKDAIQAYKEAVGIAVPRGRPRKIFRLTEVGQIDETALEGTDMEELTRLRETIDSVISRSPVEA